MKTDTLEVEAPLRSGWSPQRFASDGPLVDRFICGDTAAFSAIFSRYHNLVFSVALGVLGSREDAEDVVQEVFTKAAQRLPVEGTPDNLKAWLATISRNRAIDHLRARKRAVEVIDQVKYSGTTEHSSPHSDIEARHELRETMRNLKLLPEEQRLALLMHEIGGSSYNEISTTMDKSTVNIRNLIKRARLNLRVQRTGDAIACVSIREQLADEMSPRKWSREVHAHLRNCKDCRGYERGLRADRRRIRSLAPSTLLLRLKVAGLAVTDLIAGLLDMPALRFSFLGKSLSLPSGLLLLAGATAVTVFSIGSVGSPRERDSFSSSILPSAHEHPTSANKRDRPQVVSADPAGPVSLQLLSQPISTPTADGSDSRSFPNSSRNVAEKESNIKHVDRSGTGKKINSSPKTDSSPTGVTTPASPSDASSPTAPSTSAPTQDAGQSEVTPPTTVPAGGGDQGTPSQAPSSGSTDSGRGGSSDSGMSGTPLSENIVPPSNSRMNSPPSSRDRSPSGDRSRSYSGSVAE